MKLSKLSKHIKRSNCLNTEQTEFLIDKIITNEFVIEDSTIECKEFSCEHCKLFESECVLIHNEDSETGFLKEHFPNDYHPVNDTKKSLSDEMEQFLKTKIDNNVFCIGSTFNTNKNKFDSCNDISCDCINCVFCTDGDRCNKSYYGCEPFILKYYPEYLV